MGILEKNVSEIEIAKQGYFIDHKDPVEKTIKVGIIGPGDNIIRKVLDSVEKVGGIEIVAVADVYPTLDKALCELSKRRNDDGSLMYTGRLADNILKLRDLLENKVISYFSVEDNLFETNFFENIDAVHISSPNETHGYYSILTAGKQKHILCEKPFVETYTEGVNVLNKMNKTRVGKNLAMISTTHYLRYGPAQEYLKHLDEITDSTAPVSEIGAYFVEDSSYLNERSKIQFSRRGAIHDLIVHYVALLHKMNAKIYPGEKINSKLGDTITYTLPGYNNETAVTSFAGLVGPGFGSDSYVYFKAAKGNNVNSKHFNVTYNDGRIIQLTFMSGEIGIFDTEVFRGRIHKWWDNSQFHTDPFVRIYSEFRDEIRRLEFGYDKGLEVFHSLRDSVYDLAVLDKIKSIAIEKSWEEYYGIQGIVDLK